MKSFRFSFLVLLIVLSLVSCSDKENYKAGPVVKMNLTDAEGLFIGKISRSSTGRMSSNGRTTFTKTDEINRLFKVSADGYIQEVEYEDENGTVIREERQPTEVVAVDDKYLIVVFDDYHTYLVRKTDGATFSLENIGRPDNKNMTGIISDYVSSDKYGNIYYKNQHRLIMKIDVSNPDALVATTYSAPGDLVYSFGIDKNGNVAYAGADINNNFTSRCKKSSGGYELLQGDPTSFWTGLDDSLYYHNGNIERLSFDPFKIDRYSDQISVPCGFKSFLKIKNKGVIIAVGGCTYIYQLYSKNGVTKNIPFSDVNITAIKTSAASDDYYYLAGTNGQGESVLLKIDPLTGEYSSIINGGYDVSKVSVLAGDKILFNALRLSDGKLVLGRIEEDGSINILNSSLDEPVTVLTRVN